MVSCIALLILIGVRQGVRWALLQEIDQILLEDLQEVTLAVAETRPDSFDSLKTEFNRKALGHRQHGWFVEFFKAGDERVWISQNAPTEELGPGDPQYAGPYTVDGLRVVERRVPTSLNGVNFLRVGARLDFLDTDMQHLDRLVMIATGCLVVIAPLTGYWLAGQAAHTMGEIIGTAARLRPSHLEERLTLRGTGDELDQLARTINHLLDRIADYLDQKRDFLANAAHELRTPLAAIRSSVEVALTGDRSSEEYESILADVIDQSSALETLVNQLLLLSETETDQWKHRLEVVPLAEVVMRAVEMFQGVAESNEICVRTGRMDTVEVSGSRHHLRQVVNNLIDNAVKYNSAGGEVEITLCRDEQTQTARLTVRDNGCGIAAEDVPHVFDRFFRSDRSRNRDNAPQGTGLGLSICQAVVTAHGGFIRCDSELGIGTTFTVLLPLAENPEEIVDTMTSRDEGAVRL
ncbi:sensor histidine kinase [Planctomicrobium sp. SH664]|uniref:sensor histidine kinase n=1 Tax=Planctomicrobium sp. SH664 TaxID=3448125 RepID=UPI003F5B4E23